LRSEAVVITLVCGGDNEAGSGSKSGVGDREGVFSRMGLGGRIASTRAAGVVVGE
jgi:hypothetical protein